ncbi:MAG: DUF4118 domain-containing protein, partial [Thiobacillaceae bacterium]
DQPTADSKPRLEATQESRRWMGYLGGAASVILTTALTLPLSRLLDLTNIVMLFLLPAVFAAYKYGRGPAVLAAILSVVCFDFFFVPPQLSFAVSDVQYMVTFGVMLIVALVIGQLTARLSFQASVAGNREQRVRALFEMARELSSALTVEQIAEISDRFVARVFNVSSTILILNNQDRIDAVPGLVLPKEIDLAVAQWAVDHNAAAGLSTDTLPSAPVLYVPLKAPMRVRGILAISPHKSAWILNPEQQRFLETSATLIAIALERVHFISVAQNALLQMESELLRNSLLSALSHDLKTPLTVLAGLADSLSLAGPPLPKGQADIAEAIREEAMRTSALVSNLLDMAKLQTGEVKLAHEWQLLEEVIGVALQSRASSLAQHSIRIDLPANLPLLEFDSVLMERVFCNLLENAAKYTPAGSQITISARQNGAWIDISVADNGPGLPPGKEEVLFEKFTRGKAETAVSGVGLGLSIVRAIVEAHHGSVRAENLPGGGAKFTVRLPAGTPPAVPTEQEEGRAA